jgi:predicted transcriptional regulator
MDTALRNLIQNQKLIHLLPDETVESAFEKLYHHRITCAPILENKQSIIGLVDILDLMTYLVKVCTKPLTDTYVGESRKITTDDMSMIRKRSADFRLASVKDVVDYSKRNPILFLFEDQTVRDALDAFASQGVHRLVLRKKESLEITGILSQTNVVQALANDSSFQKFQSSVGDLKNKTENLVTVGQHELAIDAFIKMHENSLSSVAIIDHLGHLSGNLSAADLNGAMDNFTKLLRSTHDYIGAIRKEQGRQVDFVASIAPKTSLYDAVQMMNKQRIHRVYTVDEQKKPLAVISFTDILKEMNETKFQTETK